MTETKDDFFNDKNQVKSNWVKWGKVGDCIKGTLVAIREHNSMFPGKEGTKVKVYELLGHNGSFHATDDDKKAIEPPIMINEGEYWMVGGKPGIDNQMRNVKIGQIIGMKFTDSKPAKTKGLNALKIIKVFVGGMDPNYMGQTSADQETGL